MGNTLSAIKRIENRARQITGSISLAQGIPSLSSHPIIRQAVIDAIASDKVDKYSPISGIYELRREISQKLLQRGMHYDPNNEIVVTAGGIEALSTTLLAILEPKDEVIILTPAYPYYKRIIQLAKGKVVNIPLNEEDGWSVNLKTLQKKITHRTKAIIICNPNNPTGSVLTKKQLMTIGILSQRHNFFVISDDIYENFYYDDMPLFNLSSIAEFKKKIIRIVSFSKDFSLSGWRIGFMHAHKDVIEKVLPVHDSIINCAPVVSQYAALAALQNEEIILHEYKEIYKKKRKLMGDFLEKLPKHLNFVWPKGAYYFFPKVNGIHDTEKFCFDMLEKVGVATVPGDDFGIGGKGHIRLCFGKSESDIEEGMKRLANYFENLNSSA